MSFQEETCRRKAGEEESEGRFLGETFLELKRGRGGYRDKGIEMKVENF